jgi:hypothetical protein
MVHCAVQNAYLRHFCSSISERVQLGQVAIYCRISTDDQMEIVKRDTD